MQQEGEHYPCSVICGILIKKHVFTKSLQLLPWPDGLVGASFHTPERLQVLSQNRAHT